MDSWRLVLVQEEAEATSLEDLLQRIKKAAKAKLLYNSDPASTSTVHFWACQVVGAVRASQKKDPTAKSQLLTEHVPHFLLKIVYGAKCFEHLAPFVKVFKDLVAVGCVAPCDLNRLEAFAGVNVISPQAGFKDFEEGDLAARVRFLALPFIGMLWRPVAGRF